MDAKDDGGPQPCAETEGASLSLQDHWNSAADNSTNPDPQTEIKPGAADPTLSNSSDHHLD